MSIVCYFEFVFLLLHIFFPKSSDAYATKRACMQMGHLKMSQNCPWNFYVLNTVQSKKWNVEKFFRSRTCKSILSEIHQTTFKRNRWRWATSPFVTMFSTLLNNYISTCSGFRCFCLNAFKVVYCKFGYCTYNNTSLTILAKCCSGKKWNKESKEFYK